MKACLASLTVAAGLCAMPAAAQDAITFSSWGNLMVVNDGVGLFGPAGTSHEGLAFSSSITIDTDGLLKTASPGHAWFRPGGNGVGRAIGIVTLNSHTLYWALDGHVAASLNREFNSASVFAGGVDTASGLEVVARAVIEPENGSEQFVVADDYREAVDFSDVRNRRDEMGAWLPPFYLSVSGSLPCATCPGGTISGSTLLVADEPAYARWEVSAVPEPAHCLMFAGGLALLAARRARLCVSARYISRN